MTYPKSIIALFTITLATSGTVLASPLARANAQDRFTQSDLGDVAYITEENDLSAADELAIRQVIARLNHALDAADYSLYASFYADDAVFVTDFGDATGPDQIAQALEASRPLITNKRHLATNLVISGADDRAVVTSYLTVFERTASLTYVGSAINIDTLEKRYGQWIVVRHESELDPATIEALQDLMQTEMEQ
ncbi:MAG: nuclear transport factor 2 family protein [Cyanobacteria bacterium P01_G01_bin.38]